MNFLRHTAIRYLIVGGIAYIIEIAALWIFRHGLQLSPVVSVGISFWIGLIVAFIMQKLVTFQNREKQPKTIFRQIGLYLLLVFFNYTVTLAATASLQHIFSVYVIRTSVIILTTGWNYFLYKHLLFKVATKT